MTTAKEVLVALGMDKEVLYLDRRDMTQILEAVNMLEHHKYPALDIILEAVAKCKLDGWRSSPYARH